MAHIAFEPSEPVKVHCTLVAAADVKESTFQKQISRSLREYQVVGGEVSAALTVGYRYLRHVVAREKASADALREKLI